MYIYIYIYIYAYTYTFTYAHDGILMYTRGDVPLSRTRGS